MGIPLSGLTLIPFTLGIVCFSWYLAEWAIFTSMLRGAAPLLKAWLLLDAVLFNRGASGSALHRTATFGRAVDVFQRSWGLVRKY